MGKLSKSGVRDRRNAFRKHWRDGITYAEMQAKLGGEITIETVGRYSRDLQLPLQKSVRPDRKPRPAIVGGDDLAAFRKAMAIRDAQFLDRLRRCYGEREARAHG